MNTRVIGSRHLPILARRNRYSGVYHNATDIPIFGSKKYTGPSITNPNTKLILRDQHNTLGTFLGQTGNPIVEYVADLGIHPLYKKRALRQETLKMLLTASTIIHKKLYTKQASSYSVDRLGEILTSKGKATPKIYRILVIQQYTKIIHPNLKSRWVQHLRFDRMERM